MGTFSLDFLNSQGFSTSNGGSASSTGIAYDLISEGEIELVNGLSGVYFNRTPIVNESLSSNVQANQLGVVLNGTGPFTIAVEGSFPAGIQLPVIVLDGLAESTVSSSTSTTVTASSFFTTAMINGSSGDGTLVPKLRIKEANLDGSDYVGLITSIASNTATVSPPIPTNAAGKRINFDLFTTTTATPAVSAGLSFTNLQITSIPNSVNIKSRGDARILVDSVSGNLPGSNSDDKNFKYVSVNFRPGTLSQLPVKNLPSFTAASLGFTVNQEIKQFTSYFNNSRLNNFWGKYVPKRPSGAIGGAEIVINASSVAPGSIREVDELLLTISAPNGLYAANSEGKPRQWAAVFQIIFRYTNGSVTKDVLVFGPTDAEIAAARVLVAADNGTFTRNGPDPTGTIRAASKTALDFDFRWSLEQYKPFTDFQVIIKKVTTDNLEYNNDTIVATTSIKALQAFINDKLSYPHSAYAAVAFDSLEFAGNFPERAYRCRGVRTELPTNYVTREEASDGIAKYTRNSSGGITNNYEIWNGTFRRGYSDNPIWNLREMLLNKRWGLGHWVDESLINNYSFYSLARYCDELVPDGRGGLEPRFTCGVYLTEPVEAYKIIRDFCTMVLSIPYWVDGQMIIEADRPAEPVYTFTKGNIEGGIFSYEGTGNKTRPNQIAVRFNNKENFYEQDLELIDDVEDMVKQNRIFTEEVIAFGATTRGQAIRYGKWKLLTSKLQKEVISFKTGENGAYLKPGSVVNIQDADRNSVRYSGRLVSATTSSVVLDSAVSLPAGDQYTLHVFIPGSAVYLVQDTVTLAEGTFARGDLLPATIGGVLVDTEEEASRIVDTSGNPVDVQFVGDAHIESKPVSNALPFSGTALNVTGTFTSAPAAETVWAITVKRDGALVAGSAKQYKILSIGEESPGLYNISAAEHFNSKFDLIDEEFLATSPRIVPRYVEIPSIIDFSAKIITSRQTSDDLSNTQQVPSIELNWVGPGVYTNNVLGLYPDFDFYVLEIKDPQNNISIQNFPKSATMHTLDSVLEGRYEFTLRARSSQGPSSPPSRVNIAVTTPSTKNSNLVATLPRGGTFNKPVNVGLSAIIAPNSYRFTAESGLSVIYSPTAPRVTVGTYWSNGTGVFLWDGTEWDVITGTFPNGLSSTLDSFTLSAFGSVDGVIAGNLSSTLGNVTLSGTGNFVVGAISGSLSSTLDPIAVSGTGSFVVSGISGSLSSTLGGVTLSGTGNFVPAAISGSLSSTLDPIAISGTGSFVASGISGSLSSTLGDVTVSGTGAFITTGSLSSTLGDVTVSGTGSFVPAAISGSLSSTLDPIIVSGTGSFVVSGISGNLSSTLGDVTVSGTGSFVPAAISGSLSSTLDPIIVSGTGSFVAAGISGSLSSTLDSITVSGTGNIAGETPEVEILARSGAVIISRSGAEIVSGRDSIATGSLSSTLDPITVSGAGSFVPAAISGSLSSTLDPITVSGTGSVAGGAFDPWTIHAWNPDAGSNSSGIVPDAIGTAPLYAAVGTAIKPDWNGEVTSADPVTLVALPADIPNFINDQTSTITFWMLHRSGSAGYNNIISHAPYDPGNSLAPVGTWKMNREGPSAFTMHHRATGGFNGNSTTGAATPADDTWAMYTLRLGANEWRATLNNSHFNNAFLAWSDAVKGNTNHVLKFGGNMLGYFADEISDNVGNNAGFRGRFGDIRVHNKILSDSEVEILYAAGRYGSISGSLSSTLDPITVSGSGGTYMAVTATGATITQDGVDDVYTFNGSGSFNVTALGSDPTFGNKAEYLVIAGGGGGGSRRGGGGGAGGYRTNRPGDASGGGASAESAMTLTVQNYTVVVGGGGAGGASGDSAVNGAKGSDSSVFGIISEGGGGGGRTMPLSGGSGGGGTTGHTLTSQGTANQGFAGGTNGNNTVAGGGGGAGEAGIPAAIEGVRTGGNGVSSTITGTATTRAGGGSGGAWISLNDTPYAGTPAPGGAGGGGAGGAIFDGIVRGGTGTPGTTNTGGGGGGGGQQGFTTNYIGHGAAGGSGVVIIRVRQR